MDKKLSFLGVLLICVLFYWLSVRPAEIRKGCFLEAQQNAIEDTNPPLYVGSQDRIVRTQLQYQLIDGDYLSCVRRAGLPN
jgi:hypothetical protein